MPLVEGKSPASFSKNVSTEMNAGKPLKQSLAIAYAMKKKAQKMAKGGVCMAHGTPMCQMCHGGEMMAEGGYIEEEKASGYQPDPAENPEHMVEHPEENQDFPMEEDDMVSRIMASRAKGYSEGGRVANDTPPDVEFEDNQFDDLVKNDDLEQHYTGANSGDEIGNVEEDKLRDHMIDRIMRQRRMRASMQRNPVPA